MVIPGICVDALTEETIWRAFADWSPHFRENITHSGPHFCVRRWGSLLERLCRKDAGDFYSYELLHYLSARDALAILEELVAEEVWRPVALQVQEIDREIRDHWVDGPSVFNCHGITRDRWWYFGLPKQVLP